MTIRKLEVAIHKLGSFNSQTISSSRCLSRVRPKWASFCSPHNAQWGRFAAKSLLVGITNVAV